MPTGYTYPVVEGKITELKDFVLSCCRAFGACIEMRDDSSDTPIPDEFKPSDYHSKAIETSQVEFERLRNMDGNQAAEYGATLKEQAIQSASKASLESIAQDLKLLAMIEKVNGWTPPTEEHVGLKTFMLQQLNDSRDSGSYWAKEAEKLQRKPALLFYVEALSGAEKGITYHAEEHAKDIARAQDRTNWMKAVRASLETKAAAILEGGR